jgi:hypothetical protein
VPVFIYSDSSLVKGVACGWNFVGELQLTSLWEDLDTVIFEEQRQM